MKREAFVSFVLVVLFLISVFPISTFSGVAASYTQPPELVGYWKLDENSGTTAYDSSSYNNNGIIYGASWTGGKVNSALSFDGVNDYVDCGTGPSLMPTTAITLEAWFKASNVSTYGTIVSTFYYEGYFLRINPNAAVEFAPGICYSPAGTIQPGVWHHVVGTFNGTLAEIYVNGNLVGSQSSGYLAYTGQSLRIGNNPATGLWFNGVIDEVKVYNRALSAQEVWAEYSGQLSVSISPSSVNMDVGQSQVFTCTVSGGTSPYSLQWYLNSAPQYSGYTSWTFTPSSAGSYTLYVKVLDSVGAVATSNTATITVSAPASGTDWWPMFHHAPNHTGYSTSTRAPNTNQTLWKNQRGGWCDSPAVANGVVYVGTGDGNVTALNASTGALIWTNKTNAPVYSSPAFADGRVYVGSGDIYPYYWEGSYQARRWIGGVYCFNASTGDIIWNYLTEFPWESSPAVADGKVFIGACNNNVYAFDAVAGTLAWNPPFATQGWVLSSPAVADGMVFIGSNDSWVYALDETSGALIRKWQTGNSVLSSPAVANGRVFVGSDDSWVYAFDEFTAVPPGQPKWKRKTNDAVESSPAVAGGVVFVGSDDWFVYAFDALTGQDFWQPQKTAGMVTSSPAVADGKVYVGSWNGYGGATPAPFYCLNASTGAFIWSYNTNSAVFDGSPAIVGGVVYVGAQMPDDKVYAFESNTTVQAYCNTQGAYVNVDIALDGLPTGYTTSHTFTSLSARRLGTHTITVPNTDPSGHPFKNWNTGQTTPTITVSIAGFTYIAYYQSGITSGLAYTDKPQYPVGATVTLGFNNTGTTTITLSNSAPWTILDATGSTVYSPTFLNVVVPVPPGTSVTWTWDQKNNAGQQVAAGTYTFRIGTSAGYFTATFSIIAGRRRLTTDSSTQDMPSLIVVNNQVFQGYFLAYQSWQTGIANNGDIFVEKYDTNWNLLTRVQATNLASYQDSPSLALVFNGTGYLLELAYVSTETGNWNIFVQTFDLNLYSMAKKQITSSAIGQDLPSIIFDGSQSIYIAYQSWEAGSSFQGDIYIEKLNLNLVSSNKVRVTTETSYQDCPSLLYNPETGIIYVAYVSNQTGNCDIFLKQYNSSLYYVGGFQLTTDYTDQYRPSLAPTYVSTYPHIQGFQMAYHSNETGTSNQRDIFVQDFSLSCNSLKKTQITSDQFYSATPSIVPSLVALGVSWCPGYVAYVSDEAGNWDIWLQQLASTPPATYSIHLESLEYSGASSNKGTIVFDGVSYSSLPTDISKAAGTYSVSYTAASGYQFDHLQTSGSISVAGSTSVVVSGAGTVTIVYKVIPPPTYSATVNAHCNTEDTDKNVSIEMDGSSTGYTTPHTFTDLTGTHTFTVPNTDPNGHPFKNWNTGETSSTITVSYAGTHIAYYEATLQTYVPEGANVTVSPTNDIRLTFANVTAAGYVTVNKTSTVQAPHLNDTTGPFIEFNITARYSGNITVSVAYDSWNITSQQGSTVQSMMTPQASGLRIMSYSPIPGDTCLRFGEVDMKDVSNIARRAISRPGDEWWNPVCDISSPGEYLVPDGKIDMADIGFVARNFARREMWIDVTVEVDVINKVIRGVTQSGRVLGIIRLP
jgi:outer membrane protein assembly factor BamB